MTKVEQIEDAITQLSSEDLTHFRDWFARFDASLWDQQIEADAKSGKLDALAEEALHDFQAGRCREI